MASKAHQILVAVKSALESIDGSGSYNFKVPSSRIQYRQTTRTGSDFEGNFLGPRPCIVIWSPSLSASDEQTVDEYTKTFMLIVGMYLDGTVDELDRQDALEDLERALLPDATLRAIWGERPKWTAYPYDPDETLPLDGMHMEFTLTYEETIGAPG